MALYDPQQHRSHAFVYGNQDPEVYCLAHLSETLWHLGYPDQALQRSQQALTLAQVLGHPFSLATALNYAAPLHDFRREARGTQERAEALRALAQEQGFAYRLAQAMFKLGLAAVAQGQVAEGLAQMRQGMAASRATGAELGLPHRLGRLAEAQGEAGQPAEGLAVLAEALATAERTGDRRSDAELYRLKGELLLQRARQGDGVEAEACFHQALAIARHQQAKSWELRAAMSLSRLWQRQGKRAEARQLLAEVYGWFTEGFDTAGLQEAKALLEALA
jgi:predicted ATPase